jgi:hypothetical protein
VHTRRDHLTGSALVVAFDFSDPNGDVAGGKVMLKPHLQHRPLRVARIAGAW